MNVTSSRKDLIADLTWVLRRHEDLIRLSEEAARAHPKVSYVLNNLRRYQGLSDKERREIFSDCFRSVQSSKSQEVGKEPVAAGM